MTCEALWPYALEVYGRPGVEELLIDLQDAHGQCVPYLLWAIWMAASGREADEAAMRNAAELARAWQDAAVAPLRRIRRELKMRVSAGSPHARDSLRQSVEALELEAERMLLQMLEDASPRTPGSCGLRAALQKSVRAWGVDAPGPLLTRLAGLAA
jgi:uncharacterized protein (TIGR02444 family)